MNEHVWMQIHRRSGDQHVGQSLVRLARLAAAAHVSHVAEHVMEHASDPSATEFAAEVHRLSTDAQCRRLPAGPTTRQANAIDAARPVHTEVDR